MDIKESVIECIETIISETASGIVVDENTLISRESGIDSLGIVSLILELEDKFEIDLDDYLADIRSCKDVNALIEVVTKAKNG